MGRPREFDRDGAVASAAEVFWAQGYEAASASALEASMGIGRSSFYAAFGSKDALYAEALERYATDLLQRVAERLQTDGSAAEVLEKFFDNVACRGQPGRDPLRCCMVVRASITQAGRSPKVEQLIQRAMDGLDAAFLDLLKRGHEDDSLPSPPNPDDARLLTTLFQGMNVAANAGRPRGELKSMARSALSALGGTSR